MRAQLASAGEQFVRSPLRVARGTHATPAPPPQLPVTPLDVNTLAADEEVIEQYVRDPLVYHGNMRIRMGAEFMRCVDAARAAAPSYTGPVLVVHGGDDRLCLPDGSTWLVGALGSADKELKVYPGLKHEVFNEKAGGDVLAHVAAWMRARV